MSRRRAAIKREILPDPKFQSKSVTRFINSVMERGKKSVAEKIVYGALDIATNRLKDKIKEKEEEEGGKGGKGKSGAGTKNLVLVIFGKALDNVSPKVEVKSRRIGGATYQVPVEVQADRRLTLAMRWIIDAAKGRSEKNMEERLGNELIAAYQNSGAAVKKREDTHRMAQANQAFAHFRW
ncbi:MAG: 30S ribosomal protein S7 [Gammaproteobacteria bacterium]|nr:30S ribosomal protein S7 [Gammaproteobacteria bacterium]